MQIKIREIIDNHIRVLKIAKKPTREEFFRTAKICAIGTRIVGVVGFLLYMVSILFIG